MNENSFDNKSIGTNISMLRMRRGMRQIDLARNIEISQTHMSNIENGNTGVSLHTACKISQILHCSIDELVYGPNYRASASDKITTLIRIEDLVEALNLINTIKKEK